MMMMKMKNHLNLYLMHISVNNAQRNFIEKSKVTWKKQMIMTSY